ncbi:hypothetical protein BYT27DRAFT_7213118 [Phlegmacium glaucopus]|nr:hypothetical protein BYT27DRAFT_7213118 [Phlegmacium glaucopus]
MPSRNAATPLCSRQLIRSLTATSKTSERQVPDPEGGLPSIAIRFEKNQYGPRGLQTGTAQRHSYANELHQEKQRLRDDVNRLQNELNNVHQQLDDAKHLSEVCRRELFCAEASLPKADTLSISEVAEKVAALNEEIFQAAATLGEALIHQRHELPLEDLNAAAAESQQMVGNTITSILVTQVQKPEPELNPLLVQVVLQVFMVKFCVSKIQSWYPSDVNIEEFLDAIYSDIRSSEEQAVSGRWRALTRAHTRPTPDTWTNELSEKLTSVLKIASWMPGSPHDQESFRHRLPPIFKAVNELRIAIGEKFTSADLDVCTHDCGTGYVPSYMEDGYGDSRQQQSNDKRLPEIVAGTTGIGLTKLMVERGANDSLRLQSVIPAKIVLESTLKEALEPVRISGRRLRRTKKPVENTDGAADQEGRKSEPGLA